MRTASEITRNYEALHKATRLHGAAFISFLASLPYEQYVFIIDRIYKWADRGHKWCKSVEPLILEAWARRDLD